MIVFLLGFIIVRKNLELFTSERDSEGDKLPAESDFETITLVDYFIFQLFSYSFFFVLLFFF